MEFAVKAIVIIAAMYLVYRVSKWREYDRGWQDGFEYGRECKKEYDNIVAKWNTKRY